MSVAAAIPVESAASLPVNIPWDELLLLPCQLSVEIPIPHFTVGDFLRLQPGSIVASSWKEGMGLPIYANGRLLGWAEFEVVGEKLGGRITEFA